jgi:uncharacterized protein YjbI with pentapeptide repeats
VATSQTFPALLTGKTVMIHGKLGGTREHLEAMVRHQGGTVAEDLTAAVSIVVVPDPAGVATLQKKINALNAKGAAIEAIDIHTFVARMAATDEQAIALIRAGSQEAFLNLVVLPMSMAHAAAATRTIAAEKFEGIRLKDFNFQGITFHGCSFARSNLTKALFGKLKDCDLSGCQAFGASFQDLDGCRLAGAKIKECMFHGSITGSDFSGATLERVTLGQGFPFGGRGKKPSAAGANFSGALLKKSQVMDLDAKGLSFAQADLSETAFANCRLEEADFRKAALKDTTLIGCKMAKADFTDADLGGANLADADLTGARFDGADLAGCNLHGATITAADFSRARNYQPAHASAGTVGPALQELDRIVPQARRLEITFQIDMGSGRLEPARIDTAYLVHGWGVGLPQSLQAHRRWGGPALSFSDAMLEASRLIGQRKILFETVEVSSTKSPVGGKELRELAIKGLEEAFGQTRPDNLEELTRALREKDRAANAVASAAAREERQKQKAAAEKAREKKTKAAERKIEKAVGGKVKDIGTFLTALELRIEKEKIKKATSMLKKAGFQLYSDVTDAFMSGVVKSQTDPGLVYACRINHDGSYACCTQNLNICGGLRGSICKHLLVLIIGLVKAEKLDPTVIDGWVAKSMHEKAALDKEQMGEVFIKYKGAEAGEVDWRPTETLPEDYYAV